MTMRIFLAIAVLTLFWGPVALAKPAEDADREAARIAAKRAAAAYNLGHYEEAAPLYEEAYRLVQDPVFLYNLGQCYRQSDKLDKALTAYRSYLRTAPEDAVNREQVQAWVSELEWTSDLQSKMAAQKASQKKEKIAVPAEAVPVQTADTRAADPVVRSDLPQTPPEQAVSPSDSPRSDLVAQLPQSSQPSSPSSFRRWAPWAGVGVTVAFAVSAIFEGLSARSGFHDLQKGCGKNRECTDSQVDSVRTKATITNVLWGLAGASAAATGVAFYISYTGSKAPAASLAWRF
jgi:hypothetical protein